MYGAAATQDNDISRAQILNGQIPPFAVVNVTDIVADLHIYMIGVGIQQFFILVFLVYAIGFHRQLLRTQVVDSGAKRRAMSLLCTLYLCIMLITVSAKMFKLRFCTIVFFFRCESFFGSASTRKACTVPSPTTKHINTALTLYRCYLH